MIGFSKDRVLKNVKILRKMGYITTEQRLDNSLVYTVEVNTLLAETPPPSSENASRVVVKTPPASSENANLTNQEQTNELTTYKTTLKEHTGKEKEGEESNVIPMTCPSSVSHTVDGFRDKYYISPESEARFRENLQIEMGLSSPY